MYTTKIGVPISIPISRYVVELYYNHKSKLHAVTTNTACMHPHKNTDIYQAQYMGVDIKNNVPTELQNQTKKK